MSKTERGRFWVYQNSKQEYLSYLPSALPFKAKPEAPSHNTTVSACAAPAPSTMSVSFESEVVRNKQEASGVHDVIRIRALTRASGGLTGAVRRMANHPTRSRFHHRHATTLIVYIRDNSAIVSRHSIQGMTQEQHMKYYNVGPVTSVERIVGRLEQSVEWHGRIGYGKLV